MKKPVKKLLEKVLRPLPEFDRHIDMVCGVDEAGRGPLAGPVFAAAVILDPRFPIDGLRDSKKLTASRREELAVEIRRYALSWAIAECSHEEIDRFNILQATMLAMERAISGLHIPATLALIDGNRCPGSSVRCTAIVQGDDRIPEISAASILAKTARDTLLIEMHGRYPDYAFDQHKGYPTADHLSRLARYGPSPIHRKSFAPVRHAMSVFSNLSNHDPAEQ